MKDIKISIKLETGGLKQALQNLVKDMQQTSNKEPLKIDFSINADGVDEKLNEIKDTINSNTNAIQEKANEAIEETKHVVTETGESIKQVTREVNSTTSKQLGEFGFAIMGVKTAIAGLKGMFTPLINAQMEYEKTTNSLRSALKVLGQDTKENVRSLQNMASEISRLIPTNDEHTRSLITMSLNMGILNDKREEAVRGAIGLAKAFQSSGLSQETAMKGIAQAYEGNFSALQRYIPAMQSASSEAEKMRILQEAMTNGFKMAMDETNTYAGRITQLKDSFSDLQEKKRINEIFAAFRNISFIIAENLIYYGAGN
ncbi:MAG: hypothetical protein FWG20_03545 [Candidatus Cloacimonetes bacterium]|nr:hypothetical protein [Candidatus Cloacimonadota bacterium]